MNCHIPLASEALSSYLALKYQIPRHYKLYVNAYPSVLCCSQKWVKCYANFTFSCERKKLALQRYMLFLSFFRVFVARLIAVILIALRFMFCFYCSFSGFRNSYRLGTRMLFPHFRLNLHLFR